MLEQLLPLVPELLAVVLGLIVTFVVKKKWVDEKLANDLKDDVSGAVTSVYHEYVKARKEANEDGKLTDEEKKEARNLALNKLGEIGKDKGIDYAKKYGVPLILGLVEKFVTKKKNGTEE
jgi:hypothetical protein